MNFMDRCVISLFFVFSMTGCPTGVLLTDLLFITINLVFVFSVAGVWELGARATGKVKLEKVSGKPVAGTIDMALTKQETKLLGILNKHPDGIWMKDLIAETNGNANTLRTHLLNMKKKGCVESFNAGGRKVKYRVRKNE